MSNSKSRRLRRKSGAEKVFFEKTSNLSIDELIELAKTLLPIKSLSKSNQSLNRKILKLPKSDIFCPVCNLSLNNKFQLKKHLKISHGLS